MSRISLKGTKSDSCVELTVGIQICSCGYVCDLFIYVGRNILYLHNRTQNMSREWSFLTVVEFIGVCINVRLSMCLRCDVDLILV